MAFMAEDGIGGLSLDLRTELSTCNGRDLQLFGIDVDPDYGGRTALPHSNFPAAKQQPYPPFTLNIVSLRTRSLHTGTYISTLC